MTDRPLDSRRSGKAFMVRSSIIVSVFQAVTTLAGFANQLVIAYLFGATSTMDAYIAAVAIPGIVTGVGISTFNLALIPFLVQYGSDQVQFKRVATKLLLLTAAASVLISGLGISGSSTFLHYIAGDLARASLGVAVKISQVLWIVAAVTLLNSYLVAVHHSLKQFVIPALVTPLPPLLMIAVAWGTSSYFGIVSLAIGWLVGAVLQTVVLLPGVVSRLSYSLVSRFSDDVDLFQPVKHMAAVILALLPFTTLQVIEVFWASELEPGSISFLGYSQKIVVSVGAALIYGISVVLFPYMADDAAGGNADGIISKLDKGLRLGLLFAMPVAGLFNIAICMPRWYGFQWGAFDVRAIRGLTAVLPWYLLGMIPMALMNLVIRGYFAKGEFRIPALIGFVAPAVYFVMAGLFSRFFSFVGIGMAYAVFWFLVFVVSTWLLDRRLWRRGFLRFAIKVGIASILIILTVSLALRQVENGVGLWMALAFILVGGAGIFVGLGYKVLRIPEIIMIVNRLFVQLKRIE